MGYLFILFLDSHICSIPTIDNVNLRLLGTVLGENGGMDIGDTGIWKKWHRVGRGGSVVRLCISQSKFMVTGSPQGPLANFGNFCYPTLPVSFGRDTKSRWSLLSGVYARGSKRSHTEGKCVTCCGLHNSTWSIMYKRR